MTDRARVHLWRAGILLIGLGLWEGLTHPAVTKRVSRAIYFVDPFFISRPSAIWARFWHLNSSAVRVPLWQLLLSTLESTFLGFAVGVTTGFAVGLVLGRNDRLAAILGPYIVAVNSLPRIALVPLVTMIFGFGLAACTPEELAEIREPFFRARLDTVPRLTGLEETEHRSLLSAWRANSLARYASYLHARGQRADALDLLQDAIDAEPELATSTTIQALLQRWQKG